MRATLLLIVALLPAVAGCRPTPPARPPVAWLDTPATLVRTAHLVRGSYDRRQYVVSGPCEPLKIYRCGFEIGGKVTTVSVEEGASIGPDVPLATLDVSYFQRRVDETDIAREQAEADYDRLGHGGADIFPEADIERARRSRDAAKVRHEIARDELAKATCKSPPGLTAGVIEERAIDPGEVVLPGQTLFTIVDASVVRLLVRVPGRIAAMIDAGTTRAAVQFSDLPGLPCLWPAGDDSGLALVTRVSTLADRAHQFTVEISVANADLRIRPGMIGRARITLPPLPDVTVVPAASATREGDAYVVWLADENRAVRWAFPADGCQLWGADLLTPSAAPHPRLIVEGYQELIEDTRLREE